MDPLRQCLEYWIALRVIDEFEVVVTVRHHRMHVDIIRTTPSSLIALSTRLSSRRSTSSSSLLDEPHRQRDPAFEPVLAVQQPIKELQEIVVRVVADVIDLVEQEDGPLGVGLERRPDPVEDTVESLVSAFLRTGEFEPNLGSGAEQRPALLQIHVLNGECVVALRELVAHAPGCERLPGARRAVDRDGRREIPLINAVEDGGELAFLGVVGNDLGGVGEWIERILLDEGAVVGGGRVEEVVVLARVPAELRVCMYAPVSYVCR